MQYNCCKRDVYNADQPNWVRCHWEAKRHFYNHSSFRSGEWKESVHQVLDLHAGTSSFYPSCSCTQLDLSCAAFSCLLLRECSSGAWSQYWYILMAPICSYVQLDLPRATLGPLLPGECSSSTWTLCCYILILPVSSYFTAWDHLVLHLMRVFTEYLISSLVHHCSSHLCLCMAPFHFGYTFYHCFSHSVHEVLDLHTGASSFFQPVLVYRPPYLVLDFCRCCWKSVHQEAGLHQELGLTSLFPQSILVVILVVIVDVVASLLCCCHHSFHDFGRTCLLEPFMVDNQVQRNIAI